MTPTSAAAACPKCRQPIAVGSKFCASCGNDISGVWGPNGAVDPALGGTIAVEMDPNVDVLGQMLTEATLGDYDIYGELGRGGMAAVYLGLDLALNRKVAIKTMLPELVSREGMVSRFKREAQTAAALSHPHIIQIYTVKETPKLCFFVMKFIEGRSLESVITDKGQVPLEMAQVIMNQVGSALAFAHRKGVVHRDIKPANIMIDEDGWAIVTDFGIAKVQEAQNLTATGTAIGTPHYMSPEQFHNKAISGASDQYSLGVLAYEMLAGRKPFDGGTYAEIITQHLFEAPPDLKTVRPDLPDHVVEAVRKMLAKDPAERFPDCETAAHALGQPATKQSGDVVRTQMINLAKSGPQKKVRMSVPMSPIPAGKRPAAPAPTAVEPAVARPQARPRPKGAAAPKPAEEQKSGGAGKWIGIAAVLLALAGGGGYYYLNFMQPVATAPVQQQAAEPVAVDSAITPAEPTVDSAAILAAATQARMDSIFNAKADSALRAQQRADSIQRAREAARLAQRERDRQQQAAATKTAPTPTKTAEAPRETQEAAAAPPPVPQNTTVLLGSRQTGAVWYIDDVPQGSIGRPAPLTVPAGRSIRLKIMAEGCTAPWDTTVTLPAAGGPHRIGFRSPTCP